VNFLAHCALSVVEPETSANSLCIVGGFLGDFVKGTVPSQLPSGIQTGLRLHRRLDAFSAVQDDIKVSIARLPQTSRRLAPLDEHEAHLPADARRFFHFMRDHDLFGRYVEIEPIERAFRRIAERFRRAEAVRESMAALHAGYRDFEDDFLRYYPALQAHAGDWLAAAELQMVSAEPRSC
jgi:acyl carrier protein phosphodiesterase